MGLQTGRTFGIGITHSGGSNATRPPRADPGKRSAGSDDAVQRKFHARPNRKLSDANDRSLAEPLKTSVKRAKQKTTQGKKAMNQTTRYLESVSNYQNIEIGALVNYIVLDAVKAGA